MELVLKGDAVTMFTGTGKLVLRNEDVLNSKEDCILVKHHTTPDDLMAIDKAKGVITVVGGTASHASIVARELQKPCIINCRGLKIDLDGRRISHPTGYIPEGRRITVDGLSGGIYVRE